MTFLKLSLGGFLLLFVASRLLYLVLIDLGYLLSSDFYLSDELYRGTIAQELLAGFAMPFPEYRADNFSGGSLVIGIIVAGFFLLFGPTLFALKLAPLLVFTLALVFWYWTIQRAAGERAARYFAILFCFSPPLLTTFSMTAMGFHSESIVFSALTVFLLFRMLADEGGSPAVPALLGLTAGFGLWFTYIYGLTLLALLGFWVWQDTGILRRPRFAWFSLGFLLGFSPWILINVQNHFAGLVIHEAKVWEHFGLANLLYGLAHPRELAPIEFIRTIASEDDWDLYRRVVNLLYALLYLGPILTVGVLHLKRVRSAPAEANYRGRGNRPTLVGFSILYLVVFTIAEQFSDFRGTRFQVPVYPFLFLFVALALARCQDRFPRVQRQIQVIFLTSVVVLGLGTHVPLLFLDRPSYALSAKGYSYAVMPDSYLESHAPAGPGDREFILEVVQRPFLSDILPKLSSNDQRELSLAIVQMLAYAAALNGQAEDFARIERLVPPGFDTHFSYWLGMEVMVWHPNELPQAVAAVEFLRHRSAAAHHLTLVGIYRQWPLGAALDSSPEALVHASAPVASELSPHYWRAIGHLAGRYWYDTDRSLSPLNSRVQSFMPLLDPSVQRYFLQGVGEVLFAHFIHTPWVASAELERIPQTFQPSLLEGWGMALGEDEFSWKGHESLLWMAATKGFSASSLVSIQQGKAQFEALFEGSPSSALKPPLHP